jgi:hypothetical protein
MKLKRFQKMSCCSVNIDGKWQINHHKKDNDV